MADLLHQFVTEAAERAPHAVAVVMGPEQFTYQELDVASNRLARMLVSAGCRSGDRVAFLIAKSPIALIAQLGILKAGCAYVPLDPASPAPRLARIVASCAPSCILANGAVSSLLAETLALSALEQPPAIGWLAPDPTDLQPTFTLRDIDAQEDAPASVPGGVASDVAHILFTSGSTGQPKGVMVTHDSAVRFARWGVEFFNITADDQNSGHSPLHFDLSTFDIFGTFAAGATLHLVPAKTNLLPNKLVEFIRTSDLTQWFSVPSALNLIAKFDLVKPGDFPNLRRLIWCGEVFPTPSLRYWMARLPHVTFTNLYGPTEATIASSYYTVPAIPETDETPVPIGEACDGERLLILDDDLAPIEPGDIGNLYIAGKGLSPGYWRDPEKTAEAFIEAASTDGERIYRTGDLARLGDDGFIYFIGRADSQIKSRGYRIELGEIETAVNALGLTQACAVVAFDAGGFEGATICCAYVALDNSATQHSALRNALAERLPRYMLPARWQALDALPLNSNGKYDRRRLREMFEAGPADQSQQDRAVSLANGGPQ